MDPTRDCLVAIIVSCDIVGHGLRSTHADQISRIRRLNDAVRAALAGAPEATVWTSGGDGGHLAFLEDRLLVGAIDYLRSLLAWSSASGTALRITCHRGTISCIEGADGRLQLVGDGINLAGSLIRYGIAGRIVVTSDFRSFATTTDAGDALRTALFFSQERTIYLKHFEARTLSVLGIDRPDVVRWELERSDRRQLQVALDVGNAWQVVHHMKRLFQVDPFDPEAHGALDNISPRNLGYGEKNAPHPLLGFLSRPALVRLLQASELVERDDGDVICQRDDTGDAMFIVLTGQIGVVLTVERRDGEGTLPSDIRIGEGGIVGELALALNRPRTATLQAVGATAFLALSYQAFKDLLQQVGPDSRLATSFRNFLDERIVEHLYRHAPYLTLVRSAAAARKDPEPWERLVDGVRRIVLDADASKLIAFGETPLASARGLYILASGYLREQSDNRTTPKLLCGNDFDILYVNLPGLVTQTRLVFRMDARTLSSRITIVHFPEAVLMEYARDEIATLTARIRQRLATQMIFDVFISYTAENVELASRWNRAFVAADLTVYMNTPSSMVRFDPEIDLAISEARVFLPIISRASLKSDWVQREITARKAIFDDRHANILPVETEHRLAEQLAVGFTTILTGKAGSVEEESAIGTAIATIREVKLGKRDPPFASTDEGRMSP